MTVDGSSHAMSQRAATVSPAFPVTVCEATVPPDGDALAIDGRPLRLPSDDPRRIAVIGDTGCRLNQWDGFQACNDPDQWPFAEIARQVAAWQPDLIIHVGDYLYREEACPADNTGCAGSPWGDNWATWQADFFSPASPLLAAAPWLFLRGNHEICSRAGEGWFRFLDARPFPTTCEDFTDPYAIAFSNLRLVALDSASAGDEQTTPEETAAYRSQFAAVPQLAGESAWLVTHKPVWGIIENRQGNQIQVDTETFEAATGDNLPPAIALVISGHIHLAQILDFAGGSGRPTQLIVGNSGTHLDRNVSAALTGSDLDDVELVAAQTIERFGFLTLEAVDAGWVATERGVDGATGVGCLIIAKATACTIGRND